MWVVKFGWQILCTVLITLQITWLAGGAAMAATSFSGNISLPINLHGKIITAQLNQTPELTPRQRQQLQAIRQGRNRSIQDILSTSQEEELSRYLRAGEPLETAVDKVDLSGEQREMVKALEKIYRLKLKSLKYTNI